MQFTNLTRHVEIGANCYWLQIGDKNIVLDCGMHPRQEGDDGQPNLSLLPHDSVDAIILTHAHHDHVGSIPLVMRRQPRAPVFMTEGTRKLSDVMLHNSVNVMTHQREELGLMNYPLFTHNEVNELSKRWRSIPLRQRCSIEGERLGPNEENELSFEFIDAGHVLGSAGVLIRAEGRKIFYTGDVNFGDQRLMRAAQFPGGEIDVLITETTRGDSPLPEGFTREKETQRLAGCLQESLARGAVLIPVFALGKTQELLGMLSYFRKRGLLGPIPIPIYIGGLSTKLTELYDKFAHSVPRQDPDLNLLNDVAPYVLSGPQAGDMPLLPNRIYALSAGMMTEKTLSNKFARRMLSDPNQSIFFVGYADPLSPAGKLRAAKPGDMIQLDQNSPAQEYKCRVEQFNFSAHASRESIREYVNRLRPKRVILVHGDEPAIAWFQQTLITDLPKSEVIVPVPGVAFEL